MTSRISEAGLKFLSDHEGIIPYAYNDSRGFATAWIGHLIAERPVNDADRKKWGTPQHPAKHADVLAFFRKDLQPYEEAVARAFHGAPHQATPNQFDACVSLCFNIGIGGFSSSTVVKRIRHGESPGQIAHAFLLWDKPPEIRGRRRAEHNLFLKH